MSESIRWVAYRHRDTHDDEEEAEEIRVRSTREMIEASVRTAIGEQWLDDLRIAPLVVPKASDMLSDWQIHCTLEMNDIPSIESMLVDEIGFNYTQHVPHGCARTSDHDSSRFRALLDEHPDDPNRACRRWIEETVTLEPSEYADVARAIHPFDVLDRIAAAEAEAARLRKLFDDAGEGVCDVLGLIDHYQALSRKDLRARWDAEAMVSELRRRLANIARDASGALPPGVGPVNLSSHQTMARALDRIAAVASIGTEEGER